MEDRARREHRRRSPLRRLRRAVRAAFTRPLFALAGVLVPRLYVLYMRLVWATSRVETNGFEELIRITEKYDGAVALLWHEEVFSVAYGYPVLGVRGHTLASLSNVGELITRCLERCGYVVFRGGSSRRSRRNEGVLEDMIEHMRTHHEVLYGLTVDGSKGPAYRMKSGGIVIARECGKPIALVRTWYARSLRLKTWDRTAIPLPFNRIAYYLRGPYFVPEDAATPEGVQRFRLRLEAELLDLAARSYADMGQPCPPELAQRQQEASATEGSGAQASARASSSCAAPRPEAIASATATPSSHAPASARPGAAAPSRARNART